MKGKLRLLLGGFVIAALLLGASPVLAAGQPVLPHAFYGTVAIGEHDAPVGSVVSAKVGGVDCDSYTVKVIGQYGSLNERDYLIVQGDISNEDTITFYINGVSTSQTATFEAGGGPTQLNLTVAATAPSLVTSAATSVTTSSATLNGSLANLGTALSADVSFEWGRTTAYDSETTTQAMTATGSFNFSLSDLSSNTTYHFRAVAMGHGTDYGADRSFTTRAEAVVIVTPPTVPVGTTDVRGMVSTAGVFLEPVTATSEDELLTLDIPEGTVGLTEELEPLEEITVVIMDEPPDPPEDAHVIGLTYDLGPDGATFDPPITLTFSYDPDALPEGVAEEDLVLAYYDEDTGEWIELDGVVDTVNNSITASVVHFTTFAIIGVVPVVVPPEPAAFSVSSLSVSPRLEVEPNEAVTITVLVANTGGESGSYTVVLKIDGVKEAEETVTIAAGESQDVSFSLTREGAGSYTVAVDGLSGSFTVVVPPEEEEEPVGEEEEEEPVGEQEEEEEEEEPVGEQEEEEEEEEEPVGEEEEEEPVGEQEEEEEEPVGEQEEEEEEEEPVGEQEEEEEEEEPVGEQEEEEEILPPAKPGFNWALYGGIIGGLVIVAGLLYYFLVFRRRAY